MSCELFDKKLSDFLTADDFNALRRFIPATRDEFHRHMQTIYNLKLETEFPLVVHIETTNYCNQTCVMCQNPDMKREKMHIDPEIARKAIDECARERKAWFLHFFFFGEPFLNRQTLEHMRYAKQQGIKNISLTTNFSTVSKAEIEELVAIGTESVVISFEGLNRERYRQIRGTDSYEQVVENIEYLLACREKNPAGKPWVSLTYVRTSESDAEIAAFQRDWADRVNAIHVSPQFEYLGRSALAKATGETNANQILNRSEQDRLPCRQLWLRIAVLSNGEIVPCSQNMDGELSLGNLRDVSIAEAWTGAKMADLRAQHMSNRYRPDNVCGRCIDWDWSGKVDKRPKVAPKT